MKDEAEVVATVPPDFVEPTQGEAGGFIKAHRCPDGDVRDRIAGAIGFAENMRVLVLGTGFPVFVQASEDGRATFSLVGPFTKGVVHAIADGDGLSDTRCHGTDDFVAGDGRRFDFQQTAR